MSSMTLAPGAYAAPARTRRAAARPSAPAATRGQVRLTRRGRLVVFLAALALVLGAALMLGAQSVATQEKGTPEPTDVVMVGEGETLWGIAADLADDGEVRAMMLHIQRLNALDSGMVQAGQKLRVPAAD